MQEISASSTFQRFNFFLIYPNFEPVSTKSIQLFVLKILGFWRRNEYSIVQLSVFELILLSESRPNAWSY